MRFARARNWPLPEESIIIGAEAEYPALIRSATVRPARAASRRSDPDPPGSQGLTWDAGEPPGLVSVAGVPSRAVARARQNWD